MCASLFEGKTVQAEQTWKDLGEANKWPLKSRAFPQVIPGHPFT
jgi:hypothetical protein